MLYGYNDKLSALLQRFLSLMVNLGNDGNVDEKEFKKYLDEVSAVSYTHLTLPTIYSV